MNIPGKAIHAAMEAGADFGYIGHKDADTIEGDGTFNVREALEAAAPLIAAQAFRDLAREIDGDCLIDSWMLFEEADELDPS